jgi:predicted enzyme related to lactoylglutathione lyase
LQEFYGGVFDWKINSLEEMGGYRMVETAEGGMTGGLMETAGDMPESYVIFYVQVEDLQASLDSAVALGGQAVMQPTPIPGVGSFAIFSDPAGNNIGIFKG